MHRFAIVALGAAVVLTPSRAARAQETADVRAALDDVDAGATTDASVASEPSPVDVVERGGADTGVDAGPTMSEAEAKALEAELAAENAAAPPVPDLAQVNLAAGIPGIQSMNPDMSIILDVAAAGFLGEPVQTGGHDPDHNGFTLRQVEMSLGASVDPFLRGDVNLVFKDGVEIEEAYLTTLSLPWGLQGRAGAFLTHLGRINEKHPHGWSFADQPLAYGKLLGEDGNRGLGGELSWLTPLPWATTIYATLQEGGDPCCAVTYSPSDSAIAVVRTPLDLVATGVVEQFFPIGDDLSILWGLSTQAGPAQYLGPAGRAELQATDLLIRYAPADAESRWSIELLAEALLRTRHAPNVLLVDEGGFAHVVWRIDRQWETGLRYDLVNGVLDDAFDESDVGPLAQRGTAQLTFYPSHFSRVRLQTSVADRGDGQPVVAGFIDLEILIGAHGAHSY